MNTRFKPILSGFVVGLLGPLAILMLFYVWKAGESGLMAFLKTQYNARLLAPILSLSALANLAAFWLFMQRNNYPKARGVIIATLFLGIIIIWLKFGT